MNEELKVTPPDYAFPQPYQECMSHLKGLTMRDYFAAQVLCGMCSVTTVKFGSLSDAAIGCYKMADAMLEARK